MKSGQCLILLYGKAATGKTYWAQHLSDRLKIPALGLDTIKEALYDKGFTHSELLNEACFRAVLSIAREYLESGESIILDLHIREDLVAVRAVAQEYEATFRAIKLITPETVRHKRFNDRILSGERHTGHHDHMKQVGAVGRDYEDTLRLDGIMDTTTEPAEVYAELCAIVDRG